MSFRLLPANQSIMVNLSAEALKSPAMIANILIGGSAVTFLFSTLLATVVFDEPKRNSSVEIDDEYMKKQGYHGIQMAMQVAPTEQHVEVWMDAVIPLRISADIQNISKIDSDGTATPGGLVDLFPVGEPATGRGRITFKIAAIDKSEMPNLENATQQALIPMAYIKEETFSPIVKSFLKFGAVNLNNIGLVTGLGVIASLGLITGGVALLYLDKKKTPVSTVVS